MNSRKARRAFAAVLSCGLATWGCSGAGAPAQVRVASTTSLYDTGLLDALVPAFEAAHPDYRLQVVAVGTGEALELGQRRDADLVIVHAPEREREFLAAGHGLRRTTFMQNDFVLAGPAADPAGLAGAADASAALRRVGEARADFVSRGDDSGTHIRERMLWREAGIEPSGDWYLEVGQGMGATLLFAGERQAYTLTDQATLSVLQRNGNELVELFAGGPSLKNVYSIIPVAGAPEADGAAALETWMLGDEAAAIIRDYGREEYGRPLFTLTGPDAEAVP
ncbi:MAG: substrate-binding domain-containing protein [Gemmatimonadota bacterium]